MNLRAEASSSLHEQARPTAEIYASLLKAAVEDVLATGTLDGSTPLRPSQHDALTSYLENFANRDDLSAQDKIEGFIQMPTGTGKTGFYVAVLANFVQRANEIGLNPKIMIIEPTIVLMNQTADEIEKFAPQFKGQIGFYGDQHQDLDKAITVISYPSWMRLIEKGEIGAHNYDFLISDESHEGLSVPHQILMEEAFSGAVRLAGTATASYDENRTVHLTHRNEWFSRAIPESVALGELAEYVDTQFFIIKTKPDLKQTFLRSAQAPGIIHAVDPRKLAWMLATADIYAQGVDAQTGHPLHKHQAGFYNHLTDDSDAHEWILNNHPDLQRIAQERGYDDVAVAVHSKLPYAEQRDRIRDYKAGRYMAVVGDRKFSIGFDHPPMKTTFDYMRRSGVQKAQAAIGRGSRQYMDPETGQPTGLTVVDALVMSGYMDKEFEAKMLKELMARNVTVFDILGKPLIHRDGYQPQAHAVPEHLRGVDNHLYEMRGYTTDEERLALIDDIKEARRGRKITTYSPVRPDFTVSQEMLGEFVDTLKSKGFIMPKSGRSKAEAEAIFEALEKHAEVSGEPIPNKVDVTLINGLIRNRTTARTKVTHEQWQHLAEFSNEARGTLRMNVVTLNDDQALAIRRTMMDANLMLTEDVYEAFKAFEEASDEPYCDLNKNQLRIILARMGGYKLDAYAYQRLQEFMEHLKGPEADMDAAPDEDAPTNAQ